MRAGEPFVFVSFRNCRDHTLALIGAALIGAALIGAALIGAGSRQSHLDFRQCCHHRHSHLHDKVEGCRVVSAAVDGGRSVVAMRQGREPS